MGSFLSALLEENTWIRVGMVVAGSVLVLFTLWNSGPTNSFFTALRAGYPG